MKLFDRFYDVRANIYDVEENDYEKNGEKTYIGEIKCDLQPYKCDFESKIYGLSLDIKYKIFCDKSDCIKVGRIIEIDGECYEIMSVKNWRFGMELTVGGDRNEN